MQYYAIKQFRPLTNMRLTDFVCTCKFENTTLLLCLTDLVVTAITAIIAFILVLGNHHLRPKLNVAEQSQMNSQRFLF